MNTPVLHHLENSRSFRVAWALEELGLPYEVRVTPRDANGRAPASARSLHPLGRFPLLELDGQLLGESGAILETLAEREGRLRPDDPEGRRLYRYWMHYAEGSLMPPLLVGLITQRVRNAPLPFFVKPVAKAVADQIDRGYTRGELDLHLGYVNDFLASHDWFAGAELSMADIQMSFPVEAALGTGRDLPAARAWMQRVEARPAYQAAIARVGRNAPHGR